MCLKKKIIVVLYFPHILEEVKFLLHLIHYILSIAHLLVNKHISFLFAPEKENDILFISYEIIISLHKAQIQTQGFAILL